MIIVTVKITEIKMASTNNKVSKLEDWLDTGKVVLKGITALTSIVIGAATIVECSRALKYKSSNHDDYWKEKRNKDLGASKLIADRLGDLVSALTK